MATDAPAPAPVIAVLIPARDEAGNLPLVLGDLPDWVSRVVVVDNGSSDGTAGVARGLGAEVVSEPQAGYGRACLSGLAHLAEAPPDIVVFLDGDYSDHPEQLARLTEPIVGGKADFVVGSRILGNLAPGAMTWPQRFGNWLAPFLIHLFWGVRFTDLGPFRAIRFATLEAIGMADEDFGWTVEMQIKAARAGVRSLEVPVDYRQRHDGRSKVSGTLSGTIKAGGKILWVIFRAALSGPKRTLPQPDAVPSTTTRK